MIYNFAEKRQYIKCKHNSEVFVRFDKKIFHFVGHVPSNVIPIMGSTGTTFAKDMVPRQAEVFHGRSQDLLKVKQLSRQSPVLLTGRSGVGKHLLLYTLPEKMRHTTRLCGS